MSNYVSKIKINDIVADIKDANAQNSIITLSNSLSDEVIARENADTEIEVSIEKSKLYYNVLDYGIKNDGVTDNSEALQTLCDLISSEYRFIFFPAGEYVIDSTISTKDHTRFIFNNATIKGDAIGTFLVGNDNSFTGKLNYDGVCLALISNKKDTYINLECNITGCTTVGYAFVTAEYGENITICGMYKTSVGKLIITNDVSHVNVSGLKAAYTTSTDIPPITITGNHTNGSYHDIKIHDCFVDGGGVLSNGIMSITRNEETTGWSGMYVPDSNIEVYNMTCVNSAGITDGLDILFANHVTIHDCIIKQCFEGIALLSSYVVLENCFVTSCRSCGIAIGDVGLTTTGEATYTGITITNCMITDNGTSSGTYVVKAGVSTRQYNNNSNITNIFINNCLIYGQDYAFDFLNSITSNICITDCFAIGTTGPVNLTSESGLYFKNVRGYSPIGFKTPSVANPTSANPCPNNFASDCEVSIINITNDATIYMKRFDDDGVAFAVVKPGIPYTFILPKDCSFYLSDATGVVFTMFGL